MQQENLVMIIAMLSSLYIFILYFATFQIRIDWWIGLVIMLSETCYLPQIRSPKTDGITYGISSKMFEYSCLVHQLNTNEPDQLISSSSNLVPLFLEFPLAVFKGGRDKLLEGVAADPDTTIFVTVTWIQMCWACDFNFTQGQHPI